jgi:hypothetical protein
MERTTYNPEMLQKVKEALCWAYRNGYSYARNAADELAAHLGERVETESLGFHGEMFRFVKKPETATTYDGEVYEVKTV